MFLTPQNPDFVTYQITFKLEVIDQLLFFVKIATLSDENIHQCHPTFKTFIT